MGLQRFQRKLGQRRSREMEPLFCYSRAALTVQVLMSRLFRHRCPLRAAIHCSFQRLPTCQTSNSDSKPAH